MNDIFLPLEEQLDLDSLKQQPDPVMAIARNYEILAREYQQLQAENAGLKSQLVTTMNQLKEKEMRLQVEKANLRRENQRLLNLAKAVYALTFVFFLILFFT